MSDNGWEPTRWWQVLYAEEQPGEWLDQLWCETSDEDEAREALADCPGGGKLGRLYRRVEHEWREDRPDPTGQKPPDLGDGE